MAGIVRRFTVVTLAAALGLWLLPGQAGATTPAPATPSNFSVKLYYDNGSLVVHYYWMDNATNERGFEFTENDSGHIVIRDSNDFPGTGMTDTWWFNYEGPVWICAKMQAYNSRDDNSKQFSGYSDKACARTPAP
jgi:hypothetical protein